MPLDLGKTCGNCKHGKIMMDQEPCKDCVKQARKPDDDSLTKWEPAK